VERTHCILTTIVTRVCLAGYPCRYRRFDIKRWMKNADCFSVAFSCYYLYHSFFTNQWSVSKRQCLHEAPAFLANNGSFFSWTRLVTHFFFPSSFPWTARLPGVQWNTLRCETTSAPLRPAPRTLRVLPSLERRANHASSLPVDRAISRHTLASRRLGGRAYWAIFRN